MIYRIIKKKRISKHIYNTASSPIPVKVMALSNFYFEGTIQ